MSDTLLSDDPQAVARVDALACLLEWLQSMPAPVRRRFLGALTECSDEVQRVVVTLKNVVANPRTPPAERKRALMTITDALFLEPSEEGGKHGQELAPSHPSAATESSTPARESPRMTGQQDLFSARLKELLATKQISQQELARRVGCSQPAISQMLNRICRPQKRTILKLAEALGVHPHELWPDIEVADMLDVVASFQQDHYPMTAEEASALKDTVKKNRPKVRVKSLPTRP